MPLPSFLSRSLRLVKAGARLHPFESLLIYGCGIWFATSGDSAGGDWGTDVARLATTNALLQIVLFVAVVQIPCYRTGKMSNVDLAWPIGLVLLAVQVLSYHRETHQNQDHHREWWSHRSSWVGLALLLHGGRMAAGAVVCFFPYDWPGGDLSRYQYARSRWIEETSDPRLWWIKQQHGTLMQAYANSVFIAAPVIWVATNPNPEALRPLEVAGLAGWLFSWMLENLADAQKLLFQSVSKANGDARTAVLGYPPYDGLVYWLWTRSRHPNYFFEFACWNSLVILAIPSALDLAAVLDANESKYGDDDGSAAWPLLRVVTKRSTGIWILLAYLPRVFYDCLMYWTGAEAAEQRSVQRRPLYKEHQKRTNVFVPFWVPGLDHHRTPGWPLVKEDSDAIKKKRS